MTNGNENTGYAARTDRPVRGRRSFVALLVFGMIGALIASLTAGFFVFLSEIPGIEARTARSADGIVVLTGAAQRMTDAIELLADNRGRRLLVSGVNPAITTEELKKQIPDFSRLSTCCIDLDHQAQNTLGNAVETSAWAKKHGFRSLLIVTSAWHMPRALAELERETEGIELIPYPVVTERMRDQNWWSNPQTLRLLVFEYLKYLAALVRAT